MQVQVLLCRSYYVHLVFHTINYYCAVPTTCTVSKGNKLQAPSTCINYNTRVLFTLEKRTYYLHCVLISHLLIESNAKTNIAPSFHCCIIALH